MYCYYNFSYFYFRKQSLDNYLEFYEEEDSENIDDSDEDEDYVMEDSDDEDDWGVGGKVYRACNHCDIVADSYTNLDKHVFEYHADQRACKKVFNH